MGGAVSLCLPKIYRFKSVVTNAAALELDCRSFVIIESDKESIRNARMGPHTANAHEI
jgi:hypothetical protein